MIEFNSNRKFYIEKYQGILFNNYTISEFTLDYLLGEHPDYINARKMLREARKEWTNDDYMNLLKQDSSKKKNNGTIKTYNQVKFEFAEA